MNKILRFFCYFVLIIILIISIIKISDTNLPENSDKFVHFAMYFFCAGIFYFLKIKHYVVFAILYGLLIEIIQYFIPWRSFSIGDIIANSLGAFIFHFYITSIHRVMFDDSKK